MAIFDMVTLEAPARWADALIDGDEEGLTKAELKELEAFKYENMVDTAEVQDNQPLRLREFDFHYAGKKQVQVLRYRLGTNRDYLREDRAKPRGYKPRVD